MMTMENIKSASGFVDNWQGGKSLTECNLHMLTAEDSCDVSFRVGKEKKTVRAHRYVLISRSCVFRAMLCGPLAEKDEITITDVEADIFTEFLRFVYTHKSGPTHLNVTGLLYLAKKYAVGGFGNLCLTYLKSSLSAENACVILEEAHVYDEKQLYDRAMKVILDNGEKCLGTEGFKHLRRECFDNVIDSDQLPVKAEQIFSAAMSWAEEQCKRQGREITPANLRSMLGQTLYSIPFPDMDQERYVKEVLPRQILTNDENVKIMANLMSPDSDPTPFKSRLHKTEADTGYISEASSLDSCDVILYYSHRRFSNWDNRKIYGRVNFTCSHDVVLLGVYVYGSALPCDRYSLKYGHYGRRGLRMWSSLGDYVSATAMKFKEKYIKTVILQEPLRFTRYDKYSVHVSLLEDREPEYLGSGVCQPRAADQCAVVVNNVNFYSSVDLIYGFIFQN